MPAICIWICNDKTPQAKQMCHILDEATGKSHSNEPIQSEPSQVFAVWCQERSGSAKEPDAECRHADWTFTISLQQKWP